MDGVFAISRCRLRADGAPWPWAAAQADAIGVHWEQARLAKPGYFDGPVFMLGDWCMADGALEGQFTPTRFRNYLFWRESGYPQAGVSDGFGTALILSAEGHVVLGRQRAGNLNGGLAYMPSGFIDPRDVGSDGLIDIDRSVARELAEETGLDRSLLRREPGYLLVVAGAIVAIACVYHSALSSAAIADRIAAHIAADDAPELSEAVIVSGPGYRRDDVPGYTRTLLDWLFAGRHVSEHG